MADGYKAPLINNTTQGPSNDVQYNYYGASQAQTTQPPQITPNNDPQYNYYGGPTTTQQPTGMIQQTSAPQAMASAPPNARIDNNVAVPSVGQYSFELNPNMNPKPSAPPDSSQVNNNVSFSQSNYNMEGYLYRHGNENSNLKIHSPEGYNHNEITQALNEDKERSGLVENNEIHVTGRGPGCVKGCRQSPHLKTWILCILIWAFIAMKLICIIFKSSFCDYDQWGDYKCDSICSFTNDTPGAFWGVFAFIFILYLVECGFSSSRKYLSNTFEKDGMLDYVAKLRNNNMPRIWWRVECYHYETRYRTVTKTDANGNSRTEQEAYTERVTTWTASETYRYRTCNDASGDFSYETRHYGVGGGATQVINHLILQLHLYKTFSFANEATARDYNYKAMLFRWYNDRDLYQDFHYGIEINGFKSNMLGELEPGNKPQCMSLTWFWLVSVIGISPCFRMWFSGLCHKKTFLLNKQVSI